MHVPETGCFVVEDLQKLSATIRRNLALFVNVVANLADKMVKDNQSEYKFLLFFPTSEKRSS